MELYLTDAVRYSFAATWRDLDAPGHAESVPIDADIVPSTYPQPKPLNPRKIEDYPDVPPAYRAVAQRYAGPLLVGPPICDELIALIQHLFTEEEAALVQHLTFPTGKTAPALAATVHRPLAEVQPLLGRSVRDGGWDENALLTMKRTFPILNL